MRAKLARMPLAIAAAALLAAQGQPDRAGAAPGDGARVDNFALLDQRGRFHEL